MNQRENRLEANVCTKGIGEKGKNRNTGSLDTTAIVPMNKLCDTLNHETVVMMNSSALMEYLSFDKCSHRPLTVEERHC
jgi:hypothetical protein